MAVSSIYGLVAPANSNDIHADDKYFGVDWSDRLKDEKVAKDLRPALGALETFVYAGFAQVEPSDQEKEALWSVIDTWIKSPSFSQQDFDKIKETLAGFTRPEFAPRAREAMTVLEDIKYLDKNPSSKAGKALRPPTFNDAFKNVNPSQPQSAPSSSASTSSGSTSASAATTNAPAKVGATPPAQAASSSSGVTLMHAGVAWKADYLNSSGATELKKILLEIDQFVFGKDNNASGAATKLKRPKEKEIKSLRKKLESWVKTAEYEENGIWAVIRVADGLSKLKAKGVTKSRAEKVVALLTEGETSVVRSVQHSYKVYLDTTWPNDFLEKNPKSKAALEALDDSLRDRDPETEAVLKTAVDAYINSEEFTKAQDDHRLILVAEQLQRGLVDYSRLAPIPFNNKAQRSNQAVLAKAETALADKLRDPKDQKTSVHLGTVALRADIANTIGT